MVQEALLSLEVLKQSYKFANLHKVNYYVQRHRGWGQELLHYYIINVVVTSKNIIGRFNLAVSIPTAKLPNLIPVKFSGCTVFVFSQELFMFAMHDLT